MIKPPDSGRKYTRSEGSRIVGISSGRPVGLVMRYSCAIGTIGTSTPASAPISFAYIPPAFTTTSHSMDPRSVSPPATRPPCTPIPLTAGPGPPAPPAFGEAERGLGRVEVAVRREERRAEDVFGRHRREERLRLVGR